MESSMETIGGILTAMLLGAWIIGLLIGIFTLICTWKCYSKMGEPGWKSIIPFYCNYILCKHTWGNGWMLLTWFIPFAGNVFTCITLYKFYRNFGKSIFFSILGIFFAPIAFAVCAFGNSTYSEAHLM